MACSKPTGDTSPRFAPLPALLLSASLLTACSTRQMDERAIRGKFLLPATARTLVYEASPAEPGWFGREGLKITMVFALSPADAAAMRRRVERSGLWQPLPVPGTVMEHLAGLRSAREARLRLARESGRPLPPEGSVYNPSDSQWMLQFRQSMPAHPRRGWYQIRTAGTDIMRAPGTVRTGLDRDVNDFMLALFDPLQRRLIVRVSSNY